MTQDFGPDSLHTVTSWPVLARIAARHTKKQVLTGFEANSLYLHSESYDWRAMGERERAFADALLEAALALAKPLPPFEGQLKPLDTHNLPPPKNPLPPGDPDDGGW
ncbi:hypothetical protein [Falsigemmobacter faecalis]|uniref:Uncharacterized protein n=1 Tax=Falsigemmobacter faecalis TaxID=2488730 RepID=A0A3P3D3J6_9RHOB|nr:hypothetical protein [Falsigemmobacter faecalis]RRH68156.1 hypothetical protein EG244_19735 [Falsigemmobacter faecalis]